MKKWGLSVKTRPSKKLELYRSVLYEATYSEFNEYEQTVIDIPLNSSQSKIMILINVSQFV